MRSFLLSLTVILFLSGCGSTPNVALVPKLSHYTTAQQQCSDFIEGKSELTGQVEKECELFLKRLDTANTSAERIASGKLKKSEAKERKILYSRERNKLKQQYGVLSKSVQSATLDAIERDDVTNFKLGVAFPGNTFIDSYYTYMKSKSPQFDKDQHYLDYSRQKSEKLMLKAQRFLQQGKEKKALTVFEKSAEMGNPQAAHSTGALYEKLGDKQQAITWHTVASEHGVKASYLNLGRLYEAEGIKESALTWYLKAAKQNSAKAQYQLYSFYLKEDKTEALSWLEKSAKNGYAHAQYEYAKILIEENKPAKAIDLLRQASQNNYPQASYYLGEYYYNKQLYERAYAQLKQIDSADSFYLRAKMLENGTGTKQDYALAYTFYTRAEALGKKGIDKDIKRIDALLSKEQLKVAAEEKKKQAEKFASMIKECGKMPTASSIKKRGKQFHITGTASAPVARRSFIIYGDDGEDYSLLKARGIQEDDKVDISVRSTGSTATLNSAEDEDAVEIYQFTFIKECKIEEEQ